MAKKHPPVTDLSLLCTEFNTCVSYGNPGNSGTLGDRGVKRADRNGMFKGRRGATNLSFSSKRANLGTASATGKTPTEFVGYKVQAHHIIPKNAVDKTAQPDLYDMICYAGWDIDNGRNCILLPKYCGWQMWERLQYHRGVHQGDYFTDIVADLNQIKSKMGNPCDLADMEALHKELHKLEQKLFKQLYMSCGLPLYPRSVLVYKNDYKDENGTDVEAADSWLAGTASWPAKRRHALAWYNSHAGIPSSMPYCPYPATGAKHAKGIV